MPIPCYLALTETEFSQISSVPENCAWMACHFSGYSTGLSGLPRQLPPGSMVILNDRMPVCGHDPQRILEQLTELYHRLQPSCFLLDLQRPPEEESRQIAQVLTEGLPCPVGVAALYACELSCPVFLEPPPLYVSLETHIAPWEGRELWLEAACETQKLTVTAAGCQIETAEDAPPDDLCFVHQELCCSYHMEVTEDAAVFTLRRGNTELDMLLEQAQQLGIRLAVGLYQQLGN